MTVTVTAPSFTAVDLMQQVRCLANEKPSFVYSEQEDYDVGWGCSYVAARIGSPKGVGCIMGQALMALGIARHTLAAWEQEAIASNVAALLDHLGVPTTGEQSAWLLDVQESQDQGLSWGEAVRLADQARRMTPRAL